MQPTIDIVIIGLNSARTLSGCLASIKACQYPQERIAVYYADGGSSDASKEIAEGSGARFLAVVADSPTPGRQRNAGWRAGTGQLVQFLDSDTLMDPHWLSKAVSAMGEGVGAVCGDRRELYPERSVFNWIGDQEWNGKPGEAEAFGGDVLVRREALEATGGYDDFLIAGEDPELSYRVRKAGYRILRLAEPMTQHDLAMLTVKQYWRRAYRTGHAYAEVQARHPQFWAGEVSRIRSRAGLFLAGWAVLPAAFLWPWLGLAPLLATLVLLRPRLFLAARFQRELALTPLQARIYSWHASVVVVPQLLGMVRYYWGRALSRPLMNKKVFKKSGVTSEA